ncbi:hypothetical protein [Nocardia sp. CA-120079]|uniref:hypothetical protein n=1 Tax=Nocardia sp. CA-120079 TaxID=3239974 RepID=UPI003D98549F
MTNFQVDLDHLRSAASAWRDASSALSQAAAQADTIKDSHKEIKWSAFQDAWNAQVEAAKYVSDRLTEGSNEAHSIGSVLMHVANVYYEQDSRFAGTLIKLDGGQ